MWSGIVFWMHLLSPLSLSSAAVLRSSRAHSYWRHLEAGEERLLMRYGVAALTVGGTRSFPSRFHVVPRLFSRRMVQRRCSTPEEGCPPLSRAAMHMGGVNAASACVTVVAVVVFCLVWVCKDVCSSWESLRLLITFCGPADAKKEAGLMIKQELLWF